MVVKNKTKYAILGVLSITSGSGYDIKRFCDKTISHFWNENFGHIYPVLNRLQREGLIGLKSIKAETRRKVYQITGKGRKEFCEWLIQPVEYQPTRSEMLLKLSFGNQIPVEKVIKMLEEVKTKHSQKLKEYKMIEASYINNEKALKQRQYPYLLAPLRYGIMASETAIRWCDETIESIKNHQMED